MIKKIIMFTVFMALFTHPTYAEERFFQIQSLDTMKVSRDMARDKDVVAQIPTLVEKLAVLNPTHIAIATPYDKEFIPVLSAWVQAVRKHDLKVWFRGNFSSWEGWFDYPKMTNPVDHHRLTYNFIVSHPDLFEDGDIFTPVPEAENGGPGDPRQSSDKAAAFNSFLIASYNNCVNAMKAIHKKVLCGYFSTNGDIAKQVLTKDTVKKIGNRVVIDHYVKDPQQLTDDIKALHNKFDAPIVLGEFGAPIPDIHGDMTPEEQSNYIRFTFQDLIQVRDILEGINYWTAFNGSTKLFDTDYTPRPATQVLIDYFHPIQIAGKIQDIFSKPLSGFSVSSSDFLTTTSDSQGRYSLLTTNDYPNITISKNDFIPQYFAMPLDPTSDKLITQNFTFDYKKKGIGYYFKVFLNKIFHYQKS